MAVYKEEKTNTWRVIYRYTDLNCTQENGHEILTHGPVRRTRI